MKGLPLPKGFEEHMKKPHHPKVPKEHAPKHAAKMPPLETEQSAPKPPSDEKTGRASRDFHSMHGRHKKERGMGSY